MRHAISAATLAATLALAVTGCALLPGGGTEQEDTDTDTETVTPGDAPPAENQVSTTPAESRSSDVRAPRTPISDDGLRLPDMLGLPTERDLRRATIDEPESETTGGVSARPPTEPDSEDD